MIIIKIKTDNAAFEDGCRYELSQILRDLIVKLEAGKALPIALKDINGNKVGFAEATGATQKQMEN